MSSVQHLREFIGARLTAAAEEIFTEFEKTIVQYEEELDRQRRLLDISWKPHIKLHPIDLPPQHKKEDVFADQQLYNKEKNSSLNQEGFPEITEEQEELYSTQKEEHLGLKQETEDFILTTIFQKSEAESNSVQLSSHNSPLPENQNPEGNKHIESAREMEMMPKRRFQRNQSHSNNEEISPMSETELDPDTREEFVKWDVYGETCRNETEMEQNDRIHTGETSSSHQTRKKGVELRSSESCGKHFSQSDHFIHMRTHTGKRRFTCKICRKTFITQGNLLVHTRVHTGERPFPCKICGKGFTQSGNLLKHMRTHTGERPFTCKTCGKKFSQSAHLLTHMRIHTGERPVRLTHMQGVELRSSERCTNYFSQSDQFIHVRTHTKRPFTCETCGKKFSQSTHLDNHMSIHTGERPFTCKICGKTFITQGNFLVHTRVHTGERPFPCKICGKGFTQSGNLLKHIRTHTGERPFTCKTCGKGFTQRGNLLKHVKTHTDERPVRLTHKRVQQGVELRSSERCTNHLSQSDQFIHVRTHTGDRPFTCKLCGEKFSQSTHLLNHMRIHTGERPFTCKLCGKKFITRGNLLVHMRVHTGERPFPCKICLKSFTQRCNLLKHMRTHTGERPFTCETCGKKFSASYNLCTHMMTHTGEKPYSCGTCGKGFTTRASLERHLKVHVRKR